MHSKLSTAFALSFIVAALVCAFALAGSASPTVALPPCHEHARQAPIPPPVSHNCCEMGHQFSSIPAIPFVAPSLTAIAVVTDSATLCMNERATLAEIVSPDPPDLVPLRI
ncbi:MAG TPA: hypothetical protein VKW78_09920 [Terriglobales bacterium]|nr:hypothetical protein [Terriglobales bacterium]